MEETCYPYLLSAIDFFHLIRQKLEIEKVLIIDLCINKF